MSEDRNGDNPEIKRVMPVVTVALILVNAIVFVYSQGFGQEPKFTSFTYAYCMVPREVSSGHDLVADPDTGPESWKVGYRIAIREQDTNKRVASIDPITGVDSTDANSLPLLNSNFPRLQKSPCAFVTLFTCMFLHANWGHLLANMLFLFAFGSVTESTLGHVRYLFLYLISGVLSGLTTTLVTLHSIEAFFPILGASGAIAGILGACVVLRPNISIRLPHEIGAGLWIMHKYPPWMGWVFAGLWGFFEMINAIVKCKNKDEIMVLITNCKAEWLGHVGHVGGFISGMVIATAGASALAFLVCFSPALWPLIRDLVRRW
jgi:membrane associated rhomboid family serine protease